MSLQFVLGRSGTGKSTYISEQIRAELMARPDGPPLIMLVPEQATFQTEYALLQDGRLGGTIRAQALSFRRLAFRVMQETGGTSLVPIGDNGKSMLLYKLVHRLRDNLLLFQNGAEQPGFIARLEELLTEWKRYGIQSATLPAIGAASADGHVSSLLGSKLHDLRLIYEHVEQELNGLYIDSEDYLTYLTSGFGIAPSMKRARIWIDGFNGFTPKEYEALEALIASAAEVTVALTLDRPYDQGLTPHELELYHPTASTYITLTELAEKTGAELLEPIILGNCIPPRYEHSPMLAHLERHYGTRTAMSNPVLDPHLHDCGLSLHAAANRRAEVEGAARDMLRRVREDGLRWRDMAVMVRNAEDYTDYIASVFTEYNIPYFLDQKKSAVHHPLVEFIRSALETVLHGWHYEAVFRCIKTELLFPLDASLPRELFDRLENYVLAAGIDGWKWLDKKRWQPFSVQSLEDEGDEGTVSRESGREYEEMMAAREAIVPPLNRFGQALAGAGTVRHMCEALYRLLDQSNAASRLERWSRDDLAAGQPERARSHRLLWDGVMLLLDQLVEMTGDEAMTPELFAGMVETGLESLKLASVPPALDQVLIGSMDRTRSGQLAACYILGANDGILPMRVKEDGILTEGEREQLAEQGIMMAPGVRRRLLDERFLIYKAVTSPSRHLWMSWALADEEGKSLHPSEVVRQLRQLFPGLTPSTLAGEPVPKMPPQEQKSYLAHPGRALSYLLTQLRAWRSGEDIAPFWWELYNWYAIRPEWQGKLSLLMNSLGYVNQEPLLRASTARDLYGERLRVSVSRMERFVSCPFQHFAIYGLKLKERRLYRLAAPDVGQLYHAALSRLSGKLGNSWGSMNHAELRAAAAGTVQDIIPKLQSQILLSSARFQYIARKLTDIVSQSAIMLGEHARRAQFQPVGVEVDFGPGGLMPSLVLPLSDGGSIEIIGRIDRVDAAETDEGLLLRVLDYKSSSTQLRLDEVVNGLSLQMLTYLDVLITHASEWLGQKAKPAGVLYFHVHNPLLSAANALSEAESRAQLRKRFKTKGLISADAETVRMMDAELETGHSELLPAALKSDGTFYSNSSVVTDEQWTILRGSVRKTIGRIGDEMSQGKVAIEPYRLGGKSPCQYCSYKPVCQFDPQFDGNDYVTLQKPGKEELWQQLEDK
ncbi:helicase-exonuclease AddAB subunit AddB [Paenibacillus sp. GCM10023252]|uniref:helicase-exonuclease AddAB subunit AddB n=1 Tax=Paenibacillus sp. GCM10023252 TaxID=3252649 RepID=UPI00360D7E6F